MQHLNCVPTASYCVGDYVSDCFRPRQSSSPYPTHVLGTARMNDKSPTLAFHGLVSYYRINKRPSIKSVCSQTLI
jgi:hypothetical protein